MWVTDTDSSIASVSTTPVTVTDCSVSQSSAVNVKAPDTVTALRSVLAGVTVTDPVG